MYEEFVRVVDMVILLDLVPFDTVVMGLESEEGTGLRNGISPTSSMDLSGVDCADG